MRSMLSAFTLLALLGTASAAVAQEPPVFRLLMKDHKFDPPRLTVPAGIKFVLMVRNADDTPAEFESATLKVEKIIASGREATVRLGPLNPGEYPFMDDFHQSNKGVLVVSAN